MSQDDTQDPSQNVTDDTGDPRQAKAHLRLEEIKRLSLEGKTQEEIANILRVSRRTVARDLRRLRGETIKEIKDIPEVLWSVKDSFNQRKELLEKAWEILKSPPVTMKDGRPADDRLLRLKAIQVVNELNQALDSLFGVEDVALRKELYELKKEAESIRRSLQSQTGNTPA